MIHIMDGPTTLLSTTSHFAPNDFLSQAYRTPQASPSDTSTRKRKPIFTFQSPGSGVVDIELLIRNTTLEIEAAAAAAARAMGSRMASPTVDAPAPTPSAAAASTAIAAETGSSDKASVVSRVDSTRQPTHTVMQRPFYIPRPPRPLYHPLSRRGPSKSTAKATPATSSSSLLVPPAAESGRRSSSRTRRPAPKMRESESGANVTKAVSDKVSPTKRKRGPVAGAGRRKRGTAQPDVDEDATYSSTKRVRKPRERNEADMESETIFPTQGETSPSAGYPTRAKRPRNVHTRGESSNSDGTGSATRTTPVNGYVEEFWVSTKAI